MSSHLIFGLPATAFLYAGLGLALRRTKRLYDEADRREAAEGALRQSQRLEAIGQLTGGVAHDFNNLLMIISGSVQRLRAELTDKKHARLLDMIGTATQRGESLTRQLLSYSRQQTLTPQVIDLSQRLPLLRELLLRSWAATSRSRSTCRTASARSASIPASSSSPSSISRSTPRTPCRPAARCRSGPSR